MIRAAHRTSLALACAIALAHVASARAACPDSYAELDVAEGPFPTALAVFDSADANSHLAFNRPLCQASLVSTSAGLTFDAVRVVEAFDLGGLTPGTIVNATVEFELSGSVYQSCGASGCGVELAGTLRAGSDSVTATAAIVGPSPPTTKPLVQTLSLPVTMTAGLPVTVEFVLRYGTGPGQDDASGTLTGHWSVTGLPAGAWAVSCLGTTPARPASWGALKLRYR